MLVRPEELRRRIKSDEFDYQTLISALAEYERPRDRITDLLRSGTIKQLRRGLYTFSEGFCRHPVSVELMANLVYGPSYVSMEYALARHGLIPEHVHAVTSSTIGRARRFSNSIGLFLYTRIPAGVFSIGVDRCELPDGRSYMIASPEKALADKAFAERGLILRSVADVREYLFEDLRIDPASLEGFDRRLVAEMARAYASARVRTLCSFLARLTGGRGAT